MADSVDEAAVDCLGDPRWLAEVHELSTTRIANPIEPGIDLPRRQVVLDMEGTVLRRPRRWVRSRMPHGSGARGYSARGLPVL